MIANRSRPLVYLITDRRALPTGSGDAGLNALADFLDRAFAARVDMVQIRERDLPARDLSLFTERIVRAARCGDVRVLVNDRADVAASCEADGVHLTTRSMSADVVRRAFGEQMLIAASTHSIQEAEEAERKGADFVVFGPVFETSSKKIYGPPVGLAALRVVASRLTIPVLALGGINLSNFRQAIEAGAAGVAGISIFNNAENLQAVVQMIKGVALR